MGYSRRVVGRLRSAIARPCMVEPLEKRQLFIASVLSIMPLGDSITSSSADHASYRYWLWNSLADAGYTLNFVGTQAGVDGGDPLYPGFDPDHEGHTDFSAIDIVSTLKSSEWINYAVQPQNKPDIVLLHIGSNDVAGQDDAITRDEIGRIIDDLRAVNPYVTVLLAQIIPQEGASVKGLNALLPALASSKDTDQSRVILVNQAKGFNVSTDTFDGTHPNESGEKKMAAKWFNALKPLLLPLPTPPPAGTYLDTTAVSLTNSNNGLGPVEYEESNGSDDHYDGNLLTIRGQSFMRGFGVHAPSELDFDLGGKSYSTFRATIGVDDEVDGKGSVVFQVFANDEATPRYQSRKITGATAAVPISVNIAGAQSLRLVVTDSGDGVDSDHADWALARVTNAVSQVPATPTNLNAVVRGQGINLSWTDSSKNELGFRVQRKTGKHGAWEQIAELGVNARAFRDTNVSASTGYSYRVTAFNGDGSSKVSNLAVAITAKAQKARPARLSAGSVIPLFIGRVKKVLTGIWADGEE